MAENLISKIEKPWAVYGKGYISAVGKIIGDYPDNVKVTVYEDALFFIYGSQKI